MTFLYKIIMRITLIPSYFKIKYYKSRIQGSGYRLNYEVNMHNPSNIYVGRGTYINGGDIFASSNATITIGENCLISYNTHIRTDMHNYVSKCLLISEQGITEKSIVIENDVWIGYGVQVLSGVTISKGCVIGAGAVVTKSTEPYGVYVGVPAHKISERQ